MLRDALTTWQDLLCGFSDPAWEHVHGIAQVAMDGYRGNPDGVAPPRGDSDLPASPHNRKDPGIDVIPVPLCAADFPDVGVAHSPSLAAGSYEGRSPVERHLGIELEGDGSEAPVAEQPRLAASLTLLRLSARWCSQLLQPPVDVALRHSRTEPQNVPIRLARPNERRHHDQEQRRPRDESDPDGTMRSGGSRCLTETHCRQTLPIPGPSTRTKITVAITAATIQGMPRVISSGASVANDDGARGIAGYHASSEVPPSEAAAAEINTIFIPSGLSSPATTIVPLPARYGTSESRRARATRASGSRPRNGSSAGISRRGAITKWSSAPETTRARRKRMAGRAPSITRAQSPIPPIPEKRR